MRWEEIVESNFDNVVWSNQNSSRWSGMMKVNDQRFMLDFKQARGTWWTFSFTMESKDGARVFGMNDFNGIRAFKLVNPAAKAVMEFINAVKPENLLLSVEQASGVQDIVGAVKGSLPQGYEVQPVSRMAPAGSFAIVRPEKRHDDARIARNTPLNQRGVR